MRSLPRPDDPWALQERIMAAVIGDIIDMAAGRPGGRFQAMREIRKQGRNALRG